MTRIIYYTLFPALIVEFLKAQNLHVNIVRLTNRWIDFIELSEKMLIFWEFLIKYVFGSPDKDYLFYDIVCFVSLERKFINGVCGT